MYSMADLYPSMFGGTMNTTEQTVPDVDENALLNVDVVTNKDGQKVYINKKMTWGALGLIVGVMILIGVLNRLGVE